MKFIHNSSLLVYQVVIVVIILSNTFMSAVAQEIETTIDINVLWEIAKTNNATILPTDQQVELLQILDKHPHFLNDIKDASETCDALKYYGDLDKNTDCKNWYQTEWKFWKKLNK